MLTVLLSIIIIMQIVIWWDLGSSSRHANRTRIVASDLNLEALKRIEQSLERIDEALTSSKYKPF